MPYVQNHERSTLYSIQAYRGLAAIFVVLFHAEGLLSNWKGFLFPWGFYGVHLFFVLSGFIICYIHYDDIGRPENSVKYIKKRFIRIYPTYWILLALLLPSYIKNTNSINLYQIIKNVTLLNITKYDPFISVAWTLCHEILFYFVFFILILSRKLGLVVISVWFYLMAYNFFAGEIIMPPYMLSKLSGIDYSVFTNLFRLISSPLNILFTFGAFSFILYKKLHYYKKNDFLLIFIFISGTILFIFSCIVLQGYQHKQFSRFDLLFGLAAFLLIIGSSSTLIDNWVSKRRFLLLLGNASYSIYLIHLVLQKALFNLLTYDINNSLFASFILLTFCSIIGGLIFYSLVESPLLRLFRRI